MEPTHPDRLVENATAPSAGKGQWRSKIGVGVAIGLGIEKTRDGIPTRETG